MCVLDVTDVCRSATRRLLRCLQLVTQRRLGSALRAEGFTPGLQARDRRELWRTCRAVSFSAHGVGPGRRRGVGVPALRRCSERERPAVRLRWPAGRDSAVCGGPRRDAAAKRRSGASCSSAGAPRFAPRRDPARRCTSRARPATTRCASTSAAATPCPTASSSTAASQAGGAGDGLEIVGGRFDRTRVTFTPDRPGHGHDGTIALDGTQIVFRDLEPLDARRHGRGPRLRHPAGRRRQPDRARERRRQHAGDVAAAQRHRPRDVRDDRLRPPDQQPADQPRQRRAARA